MCLRIGNFVAIDPNGNITSKTASGVTTRFFFDIRDQLGEVRQGASVLGRYGYDYQGRRILKIGDDGRRQYSYDQLSVVTEADQVNSTVSKYDYGMDQLVRLDNRNEGRSFFHLDGLRSTVSLTDGAGGSRQSIFYDAWGNERDRIGSSANNFTFTGHEFDEETGLIYAKARFYDAEVGRFLTQDPVTGDTGEPPSLHRYTYAHSNPTVFLDLYGLQAEEINGEQNQETVEDNALVRGIDRLFGPLFEQRIPDPNDLSWRAYRWLRDMAGGKSARQIIVEEVKQTIPLSDTIDPDFEQKKELLEKGVETVEHLEKAREIQESLQEQLQDPDPKVVGEGSDGNVRFSEPKANLDPDAESHSGKVEESFKVQQFPGGEFRDERGRFARDPNKPAPSRLVIGLSSAQVHLATRITRPRSRNSSKKLNPKRGPARPC